MAVQIVVHPRGGEPLADGRPRTLAVAHRPVGGGDETHQGDVAQVDAVDVRVGEQVSQGDELLIEVLVVDGDPRVGGEVERFGLLDTGAYARDMRPVLLTCRAACFQQF